MRKIIVLLLMVGLLVSACAPASAVVWTCDPAQALHPMSPLLYGLFLEDINHAVDGGLYAELLQNRSFENQSVLDASVYQHLTGWQFNTSAAGNGKASIETAAPLNENNPTYVRVQASSAGYAFQNLGYGSSAFRGGISVRQGEPCDVSVWLRGEEYAGEVSVSLTGRAGKVLSNTVTVAPGAAWEKLSGILVPTEDAEDACLTFTLTQPGILDVDMASLMPQDRVGASWPGGGMRRDLVEALKELRPRFLRFPGGCVAEGSWTWDNLYRWKDTVGPVEQRRENWDTWGYMQSYGVGFYEYFCLCEEIGALPLPVVGSGLLCQAREPFEPPMNDEELAVWTQDILDLLEFALGDADSAWGGLRAEMGHPAPFDLRFLAIGNENWAEIYFTRYEKLRAAVRAAYPQVDCIVACGPVADGSLFNASRGAILRRFADDIADEHYYMESGWLLRNTHRYDQYPRTTRVLLGEFAAHEPAVNGRRPNNLYSALCEAAFMTGIERNSDVVTMCCYAPLLARYGGDQWTPDLIWFNGSQVVRTPNYYIQQMFASTLGDELIESAMTDEAGKALRETASGLYQAASRTNDSQVYLKAVNVSGENKQVSLRIAGLTGETQASVTLLSGDRQAVNSLNGEKIAPTTAALPLTDGQGELLLPPYSCAILTVPAP